MRFLSYRGRRPVKAGSKGKEYQPAKADPSTSNFAVTSNHSIDHTVN